MGFKLPKLYGWVDVSCYPGMQVYCWLNLIDLKEDRLPGKEPWERAWYETLAEIYLRLKVPASMSDTEAEEIIELGTAKAIYDLEQMPGFDKGLLRRMMGYLGIQRDDLLLEAAKNSSAASGIGPTA